MNPKKIVFFVILLCFPENPCPDPRELLQNDGVSLGTNIIGKAARYRLSIGKLKKGFQPGEKYKSNNFYVLYFYVSSFCIKFLL